MKVTIRDITEPDRVIAKDFPVDPLLGPPHVGDEVYLRERAYQTHQFLIGTVTRRRWYSVVGEPGQTELVLFVSVAKK